MNTHLYYGYNGQPLNKNNLGPSNYEPPVIQRQPDIPDINDTPSLKNVVDSNLVNPSLLSGLSCGVYCIPLLILVIVITSSIVCSLCVDIFKNKKITLNILLGVIVNLIVIVLYSWLCKTCDNQNTIVQIIVKDILPWVVYILLIGLVFLYISNRVIKR
jgi:hypothetical protein